MPAYLPGVVAVAALVLTYLFCIRPMRSGGACLHGRLAPQRPGPRSRELELELARAELELLRLREHDRQQRGPAG